MKKILIVTYEFPPKLGGIGRYLYNIAEGLSICAEYEVTVLTPKDQNLACGKATVFSELGKNRLSDSIFILKFLLKLRSGIVIWGHSRSFLIASILMFSGLKYFYKSIIPLYGSELLRSKKKNFYSWYFSKLLFGCSKILPISKFTQSLINPDAQNKSLVIYPPVQELWFQKGGETPRDSKSPIILGTLSRLVKRKGHTKILQCLSKLKSDYNFRYLIAGDGPEFLALQQQVEQYELEGFVQFLGKIPEEKLIEFYDGLDFFIMLNIIEPNDVEGFGYSFVEAGSRGVPSIGGANGGAQEVIVDGKTGWLVDVEDTNEVLNILEKVLSAPNCWLKYGKAAHKNYQNRFSSKSVGLKYSQIIDELLD